VGKNGVLHSRFGFQVTTNPQARVENRTAFGKSLGLQEKINLGPKKEGQGVGKEGSVRNMTMSYTKLFQEKPPREVLRKKKKRGQIESEVKLYGNFGVGEAFGLWPSEKLGEKEAGKRRSIVFY